MPLGTKAESLDAEDKLLSSKRVQGRAQVSENLDANPDGEADRPEGLPELQTVVALGRLNELRETSGVLAPVELPAVYDHATNCRAVAADPFGRRMDNDVGAMVNRPDEVAARAEGVIDLPSG